MNRIARFAGGLAALPLSLALVALPACTSSAPTSTFGAAATSPPPQAAPALAALQTRDRVVHLYGGHGALFATVHDDAGHLVAEGISLDALRALDPFLYEACTSAFARNGGDGSGGNGTFLDARFYPITGDSNAMGEAHSDDVGNLDSHRFR